MQEEIHFVQEFRNFDVFQIDNSGSPTYIFRDKNNERIFFRTKYSNPEAYEVISQLQENYLIRNSQIKNGTLQEEFLGLTVGDLMAMNLEDPLKRHIYRQMEIIKTKIEKLGLNHRHPHLNNFNVRFRIKIENKQIIVHGLKRVKKLAEDYKTTFSAEVFIRDYDLIERFQATNTEH